MQHLISVLPLGLSSSIFTLKLELASGSTIETGLKEAVRLANQLHVDVEFTFTSTISATFLVFPSFEWQTYMRLYEKLWEKETGHSFEETYRSE
jgi:hypothetical protein